MNYTPEELSFIGSSSETAKHRHLIEQYCQGNGVDIGSGGCPVVPWAIQVELSSASFNYYHNATPDRGAIQWMGDNAFVNLPFKSETLDFCFSSHLIEDFVDWMPILREWARVLKPGGHLVIFLPDKERWNEMLRRGQPPNCAHKHESYPGELTKHAEAIGGLVVLEDRLTDSFNNERVIDYNILFVARKM